MMKSTHDEIAGGISAGSRRVPPAGLVVVGLGMVGPLVALLLGVLTFGVQATVAPRHVPLAIGTSDAAATSALASVTSRIAARGGDAVDWHTVDSRAEAERMLAPRRSTGRCSSVPALLY